ncbi:MAG: CBS domain-containing protein [Pyrinomonadaceae bacterium]
MKVKKLMKTEVATCRAEDSLTEVAGAMHRRDCGVIPVVDDEQKVIGMITDRDICLAVADGDKKASEIRVKSLLGHRVIKCRSADRITKALKKMRKNQVKRLPVVGKNEELVGIVSITDFLLSGPRKKSVRKKVYSTLKAIGRPRRIILREIAGK